MSYISTFRFFYEKLGDVFLKISNPDLKIAFNIVSHLTIKERVVLSRISKNAKFIVEIGSYLGASACCFGCKANNNIQKTIVCIDTWNNDAMSEGCRDTWGIFKRNTDLLEQYVIPVRGFSVDVVDQVRAITPRFDLLFIDGNHSYDGVKADWNAYKNFLESGSIVVFHDYGWAEGVRRVVHEDVMPFVGSHQCLPNMWWGTLSK